MLRKHFLMMMPDNALEVKYLKPLVIKGHPLNFEDLGISSIRQCNISTLLGIQIVCETHSESKKCCINKSLSPQEKKTLKLFSPAVTVWMLSLANTQVHSSTREINERFLKGLCQIVQFQPFQLQEIKESSIIFLQQLLLHLFVGLLSNL